jgi:hypothetical protein
MDDDEEPSELMQREILGDQDKDAQFGTNISGSLSQEFSSSSDDEDSGDNDENGGEDEDDGVIDGEDDDEPIKDPDEDDGDEEPNDNDFEDNDGGTQPQQSAVPAQQPAASPAPKGGGKEGSKGGKGNETPKDTKQLYAMWQRIMKGPPPVKALGRTANSTVKSAASVTLVGAVAWLFDDVSGLSLKLLSNDLVNIFSHMFHPFYTKGVRDKADEVVSKPPVQKFLAKANEMLKKAEEMMGKGKGKK